MYALAPLDGADGHPDGLAAHATHLIEPRWWPSALVIVPLRQFLNSIGWEPLADVYRLTTDQAGGIMPPFAGLRRWWDRTVDATQDRAGESRQRPEPEATWVTQLELSEIARALGTRIPLWIAGTCTEQAAARTLAYDSTFTVPDTTTGWSDTQQRVRLALDSALPAHYPAAWSVLAVAAADQLATIRAAHAHLPDTGSGWYLVARPTLPAPPVELEQHITTVALVDDLAQVAAELVELRRVEADLDVDDPLGDVYQDAIELLAWQLREASKNRVKQDGQSLREEDYALVADDKMITYSAQWGGPVVDAWAATLTPVDDRDAALRLRRVRRLLGDTAPEAVHAVYRDNVGRYVLIEERHPGEKDPELRFGAEWPINRAVVDNWTDKTVLAADGGGGAVTLLALTPTDDGQLRVDPLPMPPRSGRDAFAYGYGGGTPTMTYRAIMRCALDRSPFELTGAFAHLHTWRHWSGDDNDPAGQLWHAISTANGPLRLSWPQVKLWARADLSRARAELAGKTDVATPTDP
ncbi:MAG: hypothetical protein ACRDRS_03545 [Pseudonocardiaceae bacterium]